MAAGPPGNGFFETVSKIESHALTQRLKMAMRIWITGCAGFLGGRLARKFSASGHEVLGLSRRACSIKGRSVSLDLATDEAIARLQSLSAETGPPDVVIHAASRQPGAYELPSYLKSNLLTTANLLAALKNFPPRQLIYTSTQSVYGRPLANPVAETHAAGGPLPYAATKRWAEQLVEAFQDESRVVILRLPSLYGAGQADSFVDGLARAALRDEPIELFARGELVRDCLHVEDVVRAVVSCVRTRPDERALYLNLGCGQRIETGEYARALVEALGSRSEIVPVDRPVKQFDLYADITEARRQIGFAPRALEESMREYASELRATEE